MSNIQPQLERLIAKNYFLNVSAKLAYKAYVRAYESHSLKQVRYSIILVHHRSKVGSRFDPRKIYPTSDTTLYSTLTKSVASSASNERIYTSVRVRYISSFGISAMFNLDFFCLLKNITLISYWPLSSYDLNISLDIRCPDPRLGGRWKVIWVFGATPHWHRRRIQ